MERLVILDGNSLLNRAFYALPPLTNSEGIYTNAVFGFTNMLLKIQDEIKPDYIVSTFDRKAPTFRHKEYDEYKAGRKKMPEELAQQFPLVKDMLKLFAINSFEIDGFEADDLIGTLAKFAENKSIEVYIVTGDRDALQLASENIKVVITKKGITEKEIYDRKRMIEEFGVTPTQFIDVKGLMGDASDNIPGVPGVGEKTAFKLIKEYGSIEEVYKNIDKISGKKLKENLVENMESAFFSKKLATIVVDAPIEIDMEDIKSKEDYDVEEIKKLFFRLQFKSLIDRLPKKENDNIKKEAEEKIDFQEVSSIGNLEVAINKLISKSMVYITSHINNETNFSTLELKNIVLSTQENENFVFYIDQLLSEDSENTIRNLKKLFENGSIKKIGYDMKNTYTALRKHSIELEGIVFDVKIAAYIIDSSKGEYELINIIRDYLRTDVLGEGVALEVKENSMLGLLYEKLNESIKEFGMEKLYYEVELPLSRVLASMEEIGFKVNAEKLEELKSKFTSEIGKVQEEIYAISEENFNINSPKQLGKILFEKLDLPVIKKTKTGYSTNAEVLEELSDKHPIIEKIIYYRQLTKLYSTYIEGLKAVMDEKSRIHSNFNQTVTTTGRLSSTEPNLQNIPVKYQMGKEIRKVFEADSAECDILSADYSQIELRVLAHAAKDENLISAFKHHSDIHTKTASEVFKVPIEEVTQTMRSRAKAVNFGIVYGISDFSLAKDLKIPKKEAKQYMDTYFERYPLVKKYLEDTIKSAEKDSFVKTIMNRRRYVPEVNASNKITKALGDRLAMNAPIQGSAADIIKLAMVNVYNKFKENKLKSTLILQVHDELIVNLWKDEEEIVKKIVKEEMENVIEFSVPLEVDINVGHTWYDAK
ncbi:DNA polymerase I [Clostridium sp. 19966]|uniref:DNA polymerase I n=1 Tax=Clostridium sp. 19966 TaxID=2768166 RepID=UPI0028E0765A|nr:DNA polymerase I [Clostridium sp. 19966]MDT8715261.1 DNA polymerase I [Clostridium sp. 19966]